MPPRSNPTRRVTAILDLLTLHPAGFTLAELSRRLSLSKSTCLAIVTELTDASYLSHDPMTRRYRLGPALLAAGEAMAKLLPLEPIRDALTSLSSELDVVCGANLLTGDDMVVVLRVGPPDPLDTAPVGQRVPYVPPYGFSFVAWSDRHHLSDWLDRSPVPLDDTAIAKLERSLAIARQRGYAVLREHPTRSARKLAAAVRYQREQPEFAEQTVAAVTELLDMGVHLDELDERRTYRFMSIHAPFRSTGTRALLSPHILGTPLEVDVATIQRYGTRLAEVVGALEPPSW